MAKVMKRRGGETEREGGEGEEKEKRRGGERNPNLHKIPIHPTRTTRRDPHDLILSPLHSSWVQKSKSLVRGQRDLLYPNRTTEEIAN